MKYFYSNCLKQLSKQQNAQFNFDIGAVNAIQKKFVQLHEIDDTNKLKVHFYQHFYSIFILTSAFTQLDLAFYFNTGKKLWTYKSFSTTCFYYYKKHPNSDNKFDHVLHAFNSSFMTVSLYLRKIQIWRNLNVHCYYLISTKSVI